MIRIFFLALFFLPVYTIAQDEAFNRLEFSAGLSFSKPLNISKDISFQSGNGVEIGVRYSFVLKENHSFFLSSLFSYTVYNIEGYFEKLSNKDKFQITENNVKSNSLILIPASLNIGFQTKIKKEMIGAISTGVVYNNNVLRKYKTGNVEAEEKYVFQKKINFIISGQLGFQIFEKRKKHIDLFVSYYLTSLSAENEFNPFTIGIRYAVGLL